MQKCFILLSNSDEALDFFLIHSIIFKKNSFVALGYVWKNSLRQGHTQSASCEEEYPN